MKEKESKETFVQDSLHMSSHSDSYFESSFGHRIPVSLSVLYVPVTEIRGGG